MTISQPRSHRAGIAFGLFFVIVFARAFLFKTASPHELVALPYMASAWVLILYAEVVRDSRSVQIDLQSSNIVEQFRSWRYALKIRTYSLDQFGSVVSYVTPSRSPINLVELVTRTGGESLCLVWYRPSSSAKSFWSIPRDCEAPKAEALRKTLAQGFQLQDRGFLGVRWPGAYVSPAPNPADQQTRVIRRAAR